MPQGTATLSTLRSVGGYLSLTPGAAPGEGIIYTEAANTTPIIDTLTLAYGGTTINFPDIRIVRSVFLRRGGKFLMRHRIKDQRWKIEQGKLGGRFNRRGGDNEPVDDANKKSAQELFDEIADQLDITIDSASADGDSYPDVDWDASDSVDAINSLCRQEGLAFCPVEDGSYKVHKVGEGDDLPTSGSMNNSQRTMQSAKPRYVRVVCGPTEFQAMFRLRAIGQESDGTWKQPIDLSYRPFFGWGSESPESFAGVGANRYLALKTVWRYYQISWWEDAPLDVPEMDPDDIFDPKQARPILDHLLESAEDKLTAEQLSQGAKIFGEFANGHMVMATTSGNTEYLGDFEVQGDEGRVFFPLPVYKFTLGQTDEARLYLRCAYNARHENGQLDRYVREREIEPASDGVAVVYREDLVRRFVQQYSFVGDWLKNNNDDNLSDIRDACDAYIDLLETKFDEAKDIEYDGFRNDCFPNGKIERCEFRWGNGELATTRASTNMDFDFLHGGG